MYKNSFSAFALLLSVAGFAQSTPSASLYFGLNGGAMQTGEFAGSSSIRYKTKKNTTFSIGTININANKENGPSSRNGSNIHYGYVGFYGNVGKVITLKNDKFFLNLQTGPSITNKFEVSNGGLFDFDFDFGGTTTPPPTPPPPAKEKSKFGLYSSASINYQLLKFMQVEIGVNGNVSPIKTFGGVYLGIRFGLNNLSK